MGHTIVRPAVQTPTTITNIEFVAVIVLFLPTGARCTRPAVLNLKIKFLFTALSAAGANKHPRTKAVGNVWDHIAYPAITRQ